MLLHLLYLLAHLYPAPSIRILSRFHDPQHFFSSTLGLTLLKHLQLLILVLFVLLYVERPRHVLENIIVLLVAILPKVVKEVLLIGEEAVMLNVVVGELHRATLVLLPLLQKAF